jgi:hypothetical protein
MTEAIRLQVHHDPMYGIPQIRRFHLFQVGMTSNTVFGGSVTSGDNEDEVAVAPMMEIWAI